MKRKSKRSLTRRIKISATGVLMRRTQNMRHLRRHKGKAQIRRMKSVKKLEGRVNKRIKHILGV